MTKETEISFELLQLVYMAGSFGRNECSLIELNNTDFDKIIKEIPTYDEFKKTFLVMEKSLQSPKDMKITDRFIFRDAIVISNHLIGQGSARIFNKGRFKMRMCFFSELVGDNNGN